MYSLLRVSLYIYMFQFLNFTFYKKKNYTKHNVSRLMTILSSQNSLYNINMSKDYYIDDTWE